MAAQEVNLCQTLLPLGAGVTTFLPRSSVIVSGHSDSGVRL